MTAMPNIKQLLNLSPVLTIVGTILVALIAAYAAYSSEKRQRRRTLYAQAYQDILAWGEMLYRIRRRGKTKKEADELVNRFHDLQEKILYNQGWISTESLWLGRAYQKLVFKIKSSLEDPIIDAWQHPLTPRWKSLKAALSSTERTEETAIFNEINKESRRFLRDVRWQLSWWRAPRLLLMLRNIYWSHWRKKK